MLPLSKLFVNNTQKNKKIVSLYLSFLNKLLFHKGTHIHFISQNCKVDLAKSTILYITRFKLTMAIENEELCSVSILNKEEMSFNLNLNFAASPLDVLSRAWLTEENERETARSLRTA